MNSDKTNRILVEAGAVCALGAACGDISLIGGRRHTDGFSE